jgi:hypothetical protein
MAKHKRYTMAPPNTLGARFPLLAERLKKEWAIIIFSLMQ